jgi:hypothetical protein
MMKRTVMMSMMLHNDDGDDRQLPTLYSFGSSCWKN